MIDRRTSWLIRGAALAALTSLTALAQNAPDPLPDPVIPGSAEWLQKVGADNPAEAGRDDPSFGAESNPTGEPIGGGTGYSRILSPDEADVVVQDADGLLAALENATPGTVIYVRDDAVVDLTPYENISIPGGVTLASGRGRDGSEGGLIYTYTVKSMRLFRTDGPNIRLTGLRLEGSYPGRERLTQRPSLIGVYHPHVEVDNCEIFAWSSSAVGVGSGATEGTWVHHNYIHHNQRAGLGYGVSLSRTHVLIEGNLFDFCRHAIASSGTPGSGYTARYNVHLENTISHVFDMHGARDFEKYRLVGLWHFDEGQGTSTNDYSIYNGDHDGTLINTAEDVWTDGRIGKGLNLDGQDDYVNLGKQRQLSPARGLTLAAWIRPDNLDGTQAVFSKADTGARGSGYSLRMVDSQLEGVLYREDGTRCAITGGTIRTDRWQHVALRWNGKTVTLFLDGKPVGETACSSRKLSPNHLVIGRDSTTETSFFDGGIDEARLYSQGSSDQDIQRIAQGHGDIAGRLILMHHNTIRPTNYAALTVRGRPSVGCWVHHNRFDAPEGGSVVRQSNATGNMHVSDNRYLGRGLAAAPDFTQAELYGKWDADRRTGTALPNEMPAGAPAVIHTGEDQTPRVDAEADDALTLDRNDQWLDVPTPEQASPDQVTIGVRMRVDDLTSRQVLYDDGLFRLFHRGDWAGDTLYFLMRIREDTRGGESSWNYYTGVKTKRAVVEGEWFELVGERAGNTMRVYLNGMLESSAECVPGFTPNIQAQGNLAVGQDVAGALDTVWIRNAQRPPDPAATPDTSGTLALTGTEGYQNNGVEPDSGDGDTLFTFRVRYRDASGREPALGYPRLRILREGLTYVNEGPVSMMPVSNAPVDQGRLYTYSMRLPRGTAYEHEFEAETADGALVKTTRFQGPDVISGSFAPVLSWTSQRGYVRDGVEPEIGNVATDFDFRIQFSDTDGDDPAEGFPKVHVLKGGDEIPGSPFAMQPMSNQPTWQGRPYQVKMKLEAGADYAYYFTAKDSDGNPAPKSLTRRSPTVDRAEDIAPPDLSAIRVTDVRNGSATIRWKTDEPAAAFVEFGAEPDYGQRREAEGRATSHAIVIDGLEPGQTVHYRVGAADAHGNRAVSGDYTFTAGQD